MFATWAELEGDEGEDPTVFELRKHFEFNAMFNDGLIDVESSGIELEEVPENCD